MLFDLALRRNRMADVTTLVRLRNAINGAFGAHGPHIEMAVLARVNKLEKKGTTKLIAVCQFGSNQQ